MFAFETEVHFRNFLFKVGGKVGIKDFGIDWLKEIKMTDYGSLQVDFYPPKRMAKNPISIVVLGY